MCKGSVNAKSTREAETGDITVLGFSSHGIPIFTRTEDGDGEDACVTCIKTGRNIRFSGVPAAFQEEYEVGASFEATFVEEPDDSADKIFFGDSNFIYLWSLMAAMKQGDEITVEMLDAMDGDELDSFIDTLIDLDAQAEPAEDVGDSASGDNSPDTASADAPERELEPA